MPSPSSLTGRQKYLPAESSVARSMVNCAERERVLESLPSFHQRYSGAGKPGGSAPHRIDTLLPSTALGDSGLMNALPVKTICEISNFTYSVTRQEGHPHETMVELDLACYVPPSCQVNYPNLKFSINPTKVSVRWVTL